MTDRVRVAVVGVGNCASALVQGVQFYRAHPEVLTGLMHPTVGPYTPAHIDFVAAFDVSQRKIGLPLEEAIFAEPNCVPVMPGWDARERDSGVVVQSGLIGDGVAEHVQDVVPVSQEGGAILSDIVTALRRAEADVLVNYLPVGSQVATEFYATAALEAGCGFVNAIPVFLASTESWRKLFETAGLPLIGDDIKSQYGATILHRIIVSEMGRRGLKVLRTSQLNVGGNMDFRNMMDAGRLGSKKKSKGQAVTSMVAGGLSPDNVHIGPSDYVPFLGDSKWAHIHVEAEGFARQPIRLECKLEVPDSPNSAGVVIDAVRCAKMAMRDGVAGALVVPSAFLMKSPPVQVPDTEAAEAMTEWCR